MSGLNRPALFVLTLLVPALLLLTGPVRAKPQTPETVLLMTSPRVGELKNLLQLAEMGWLETEGLKVIGLSHSAEWSDYTASHRWLNKSGPGWIELLTVDCDLTADKVFSKNDCTAEFTRLFQESDGIIFTGGPDIPPALYGQSTLLTTVVSDPPRHYFEISFLVHLLKGDSKAGLKPLLDARKQYLVLGLCLGMQTMNVASGGTLYQDIPSLVYGLKSLEQYAKLPPHKRHRSAEAQLNPGAQVGWAHIHPLRFRKHPLREKLLKKGETINTVSLHHQAPHKLGRGLQILATTRDGKVVEAFTHRKYPAVIGVQFHPEKRVIYQKDMIYHQSISATVNNYIHARMSKDSSSMEFHKRFWQLIKTWLERSAQVRRAS